MIFLARAGAFFAFAGAFFALAGAFRAFVVFDLRLAAFFLVFLVFVALVFLRLAIGSESP